VWGDGVYFHNYTQIDKETSYNLKNIICNKEGSTANGDSDPLILISAHYDNRMQNISQTNARAPGADDNASGVAAILELARILSKVNLKNNIQFVLFSGEEQGQWGSTVYANHLQANDTRFNTVVNLDMIGYPPHGLNKITVEYDQGNKITTNDIYSKNIAHFIENIASEYTNLETSLHTLGKTDLIPFEATGNIVIGLHDGGSELNPNYHNVSDTLSTLDIEYLASVTKLALATILNLDELDHTTSLFSAQNDRIMKEHPVYG
jgi:Zn-dependent M28 family amino/carboxypeptidase